MKLYTSNTIFALTRDFKKETVKKTAKVANKNGQQWAQDRKKFSNTDHAIKLDVNPCFRERQEIPVSYNTHIETNVTMLRSLTNYYFNEL